MEKIFFTFCLLVLSHQSFAQTINQIDSLSAKMCESLRGIKVVKDDVQVTMIFQKHLPGFYDLLKVETQQKADSIRDLVYYRLQRNCHEFSAVLSELEENKSDWKSAPQKPLSTIKSKSCKLLFQGGKYYYKEYDGKIVHVIIANEIWEETFEDGTKSKLKFIPKDNCEFDLSFLESNNEMRKNFSVQGDVYHYGIFDYKDKIYAIWVFSKGIYHSFRLYEAGSRH